jgi:hypothetical protein
MTLRLHRFSASVLFQKFAVGVRAKSNFWIGDWVSFRKVSKKQPVLGIELHSCFVKENCLLCAVLSFGGAGYRIQTFQWIGIGIVVRTAS